jgi:3-hydroxyisobutyrate dehydrogenase-like beta-hydroxyacid dehydrogenase
MAPQVRGNVGFIGLGHMGKAMAENLAAVGYQVIAYVRRPEQTAELAAAGLKPSTDMSKLSGCDVVISMLSDDNAIREVVLGHPELGTDGLAAILPEGAIHVSMSTISTAASSYVASEHARRGQGYVAAPVFGNPDAAKARQLYIVVAGAEPDVKICRRLFEHLGQRTFVVGTDPAHANLVKLLGNMITATTLEALSESIALARKRGLDPKTFVDVLTNSMHGSIAQKIYGEKIVTQSHAPGFPIPLALKDVRLTLAEAESAAVPMPSVSVVRDRMINGIAHGHGDLDWSALALVAREAAGA